eukprot:CAMPEP_0195514188 /NCGR_PEP_ID=MMETSP0794_2-20130614/5647_1 /TAXON_ID=515487 /ORGANISM="Stephanopyxis turris, Strain CCMP 815" /LENGTH=160 /DNA_ID=CAMNT_0040642375 /DNA_START=70 /DNA_END=552 /DNA_ORIENTATION=+
MARSVQHTVDKESEETRILLQQTKRKFENANHLYNDALKCEAEVDGIIKHTKLIVAQVENRRIVPWENISSQHAEITHAPFDYSSHHLVSQKHNDPIPLVGNCTEKENMSKRPKLSSAQNEKIHCHDEAHTTLDMAYASRRSKDHFTRNEKKVPSYEEHF